MVTAGAGRPLVGLGGPHGLGAAERHAAHARTEAAEIVTGLRVLDPVDAGASLPRRDAEADGLVQDRADDEA